jgi:hypothetical protein
MFAYANVYRVHPDAIDAYYSTKGYEATIFSPRLESEEEILEWLAANVPELATYDKVRVDTYHNHTYSVARDSRGYFSYVEVSRHDVEGG